MYSVILYQYLISKKKIMEEYIENALVVFTDNLDITYTGVKKFCGDSSAL